MDILNTELFCVVILLFCCCSADFDDSAVVPGAVGEGCNNYGGAPGRCSLVKDCPLALVALAKGKPLGAIFKRCGWDGKEEVLCCPSATAREPELPRITTSLPVWSGDDVTEGNQQSRFTKRKCEQACEDILSKVKVKPPVDFNIIDGEEVDQGEFPHMAALGYEDEESDDMSWRCGASLISSRYLLTAGHCVVNQVNSVPSVARLGVIDLININNSKAQPQDFNIIDIKVHARYTSNKQNDIALLKLNRDVDFNNMVYPACLYTEHNDPQGLLVTGWGRVKRTDTQSRSLARLLKGTLSPVDVPECNKIYQKRSLGTKTVTGSQICAFSNITDTCDGDSGGPLQVLNRIGTYSLVGVTSYGFGCGGKIPGVYTRVSKYLNWIESIVWPN